MKLIPAVIYIVISVLVVFSACAGGNTIGGKKAGNSTITEGVMTSSVDDDSKPTSPAKTSFIPMTPVIYCSFKVAGVMPEDMVKASWYYVKGEAAGKENELLNETFTIAQSTSDSYYLAFYLDKPASGWYKGDYKVVLSINSAEKLTVPFKIE